MERSRINKRCIEALIKAGAFDTLELNRACLLASVDRAFEFSAAASANVHQVGLFDMGDGDDFGPDEGGDAIEMDDTDEMEPGMMEAVSLKAAPKPVTSEEGGVNKKSTYAANSGQAGMASRPVHTGAGEGGHHDTSAYSNNTKDLIGKVGNTPAQGTQKPSAAPKPKMGAGSEGQNNKSPLPTGRRG